MPRKPKQVQTKPQQSSQPEAKVEKTQPISKPKKFKKTIDALQRIERSKHQRIFLLSAQRTEQEWTFKVLGVFHYNMQASGSQYHVKTSTQVHCTCTDFRIKRKPCKHIFFIITQVAQNDQCLDYFNKSNAHISKGAYKILDSQLTDRLRSRMSGDDKKDPSEIDLKDDTNCVVCFTDMEKESEDLEDCPQCKKYFHTECISQWKKHNVTCPLCRGQLAKTSTDPLGQLKDIKI